MPLLYIYIIHYKGKLESNKITLRKLPVFNMFTVLTRLVGTRLEENVLLIVLFYIFKI